MISSVQDKFKSLQPFLHFVILTFGLVMAQSTCFGHWTSRGMTVSASQTGFGFSLLAGQRMPVGNKNSIAGNLNDDERKL